MKRPERLSYEASGLPWSLVAKDGVEDHEQLPHGRRESKLGGSAGTKEALIEGGNGRIVANGGKGGHVQHVADRGAAPGQSFGGRGGSRYRDSSAPPRRSCGDPGARTRGGRR
jgi:hypothetical protein